MKLSDLVKNNIYRIINTKEKTYEKLSDYNQLNINDRSDIIYADESLVYKILEYKREVFKWRPIIATGGEIEDKIIDNKLYRIHAFKSVGDHEFNVQDLGNITNKIDVLVVAGGGSGGGTTSSTLSGGGGAGG